MTDIEMIEEEVKEEVEQVSEDTEAEAKPKPKPSVKALELGEKANRFIRSKVSRWLLPADTRGVTKGKSFDVVNEHQECLGTITIIKSTTVNILSVQHKEAIEMGHVSQQAMLVDWFYHQDNDAYMEWSRENIVHPTKVTGEFVEFIKGRPEKVCNAKMIVLEFVKATTEAKQSGG